jgi:hypothetical protein
VISPALGLVTMNMLVELLRRIPGETHLFPPSGTFHGTILYYRTS